MANLDLASLLESRKGFYASFNSNTTTNGDIIDTQGANAIALTYFANVYTDGTYTPSIETSPNPDMSGATTLTGNYIIGSLTPITGVLGAGVKALSFGVISNERYVRLKFTSTSVTSGATITATINLANNILPNA